MIKRRHQASRIMFLFGFMLLAGAGLGTRLFFLQVLKGPSLAAAAAKEQLRTIPIVAQRGNIEGANGQLFAVEFQADRVYAIPAEVHNPKPEAAALAGILGLKAAQLEQKLTSKSHYVVLDPRATLLAGQTIKQDFFSGVGITPTTYRVYPGGMGGEPAVGYVNASQTGIAGAELSYNSALAGKNGREVVHTDAYGHILSSKGQTEQKPVPGATLQLTIDDTLQNFAQDALDQAVSQHQAASGRIIIEDPRSGDILAMAQWPTFDPSGAQSITPQDLQNQSAQWAFPPGSVFKPIVAATALMDGTATLQSTFYDPGYKVVDGRTIHSWKRTGFGTLNFSGIMEQSSDVGFADLGLGLGKTKFYQMLNRFNLGKDPGTDLPGATAGIIPPEAKATPLDIAEMSFGQTLIASPLQLMEAIGAIANGGTLVSPHIGKALIENGKVTPIKPTINRRIIPASIASTITQILVKTVNVGIDQLAKVPGYSVAGKTGTAQLPVHGQYVGHYMGGFIGYAPADNPKVLVLVQLNQPVGNFFGGVIAAPVFAQLLPKIMSYLKIPPSTPVAPTKATVPSLDGMSLLEAGRTASENGFALAVSGGGTTVISQKPAAGSSAPSGSSISVTTQGAPSSQGVPDVLGMSMGDAARALAAKGYTMVPKGSGLAKDQNPAPGTAAPSGTKVTVTFVPSPSP